MLFAIHLSVSSYLCSWLHFLPISTHCLFSLGCHELENWAQIQPISVFHLGTSHIKRPWSASLSARHFCLVFSKGREVYFNGQGPCKSCTTNHILKFLWWPSRCSHGVPSLPWNYSQKWRCINNFPLCFVFGFPCLVKHIRRIGCGKNLAFLSCQSLSSVGWHNLKWISNNLLVALVPYSPRCRWR